MPEHFPTFNRAARLIRSASPGGRTLFQRTRRTLTTERGLLRAGLYVIMFLGLLYYFIAALQSMMNQTLGPGYFIPGYSRPPDPDQGLAAKAVTFAAVLLQAIFGLPQIATLAIFACLVALVVTSERPSALEVEPRKPAEES